MFAILWLRTLQEVRLAKGTYAERFLRLFSLMLVVYPIVMLEHLIRGDAPSGFYLLAYGILTWMCWRRALFIPGSAQFVCSGDWLYAATLLRDVRWRFGSRVASSAEIPARIAKYVFGVEGPNSQGSTRYAYMKRIHEANSRVFAIVCCEIEARRRATSILHEQSSVPLTDEIGYKPFANLTLGYTSTIPLTEEAVEWYLAKGTEPLPGQISQFGLSCRDIIKPSASGPKRQVRSVYFQAVANLNRYRLWPFHVPRAGKIFMATAIATARQWGKFGPNDIRKIFAEGTSKQGQQLIKDAGLVLLDGASSLEGHPFFEREFYGKEDLSEWEAIASNWNAIQPLPTKGLHFWKASEVANERQSTD